MSGTYVACCWRSGEIDILRATLTVPPGVIVFAKGPRKRLEEIIRVRARHSYHAELYLVPGVPEADDDDEAATAMEKWAAWAFADLPELLALSAPGGRREP